MAFQLAIEMVGLCLFVPDPDNGALYVLLPGTSLEHGVDPHAARLCFDAAYGRPGSTKLDNFTTLVPVERTELELVAGEPLIIDLPPALVNVQNEARRPLLPGLLRGTDPPGLLTARAVLRSGRLGEFAPGACWNYPNDTVRRPMANRLQWELGAREGEQLDLGLTSLSGDGASTMLPPLYPVNGRIELQLYYTPRDELPPIPLEVPPPPVGSPAHHFAAYYQMFEQPVAADPLPTYFGISCGAWEGGSPYTCMSAQTDPPPPIR